MSKCEQCIIRQFNSLKALTKEELVRISACKTSKVVKKGETIFEEGESLKGVYCVRDGVCKLTKLSANGKDQIVRLVVKGELLGQRSLVGSDTTNLSAVALKDMEICFIPRDEIINDLQKSRDFSMDMLQNMALDLRESDNIIVDMAQKSVKQRMAETLLHLQEKFGEDNNGMLDLVLSREDYANLVGTATESAIRILSEFKREGYITTSGKQIKINNIEALRRVE